VTLVRAVGRGLLKIAALILFLSLLMESACMYTVAVACAGNAWQQKYRPLIGGIQIAKTEYWWIFPYEVRASIGFPAYYEIIDRWCQCRIYGFVSAGHFADVGDSIYQPTTQDENYVGYVSRDREDPDALFVYTETVPLGEKPDSVAPKILIDAGRKYDIHGYMPRRLMRVGDPIYKVGRTTGRTGGVVVDIAFNYAIASYWSEPGDSGGTVYRLLAIKPDYPVYLYVYGIHSGRTTYEGANRAVFVIAERALEALDIRLYTIYS